MYDPEGTEEEKEAERQRLGYKVIIRGHGASSGQDVIPVKYKCLDCKEEDTLKLYPMESVPLAINCFKCHKGQGQMVDKMLANKVGMRPLPAPGTEAAKQQGAQARA